MILVKVAYDAYNQQFRLVDPRLSHMFEDGENYLLVVDIFPTDLQNDDALSYPPLEMGHA